MKKVIGSVIALTVSSVLLTSWVAANANDNVEDNEFLGSEYYTSAKEKTERAGLQGEVFAGKDSPGHDFILIKFETVTGEEILKAVETLKALNVPNDTDLKVEWDSIDGNFPSHIWFNPDTDMDKIEKFAHIWDENREQLAYADYDLTNGDNPEGKTPEAFFEIADDANVEDVKTIVGNINAVISGDETMLYSIDHKNIAVIGSMGTDSTVEAIDVASQMIAYASSLNQVYPNVDDEYVVRISNHVAEAGYETLGDAEIQNFTMSFDATDSSVETDAGYDAETLESVVTEEFKQDITDLGYSVGEVNTILY